MEFVCLFDAAASIQQFLKVLCAIEDLASYTREFPAWLSKSPYMFK
jgi:hypothetical protein